MADKRPEPHVLNPITVTTGPNRVSLAYCDPLLPEGNFEICADRLNALKTSGRIHGFVSIISINGNGKARSIFVPEGFDFHSHSYKDEFARTMRAKMPEIDWGTIIDRTAYEAIAHLQAGAPHAIVDDSTIEFKPIQYLAFPLLAKNQPNILYGRKGSNKTTLMLQMARCIAGGWHDNPFFAKVSAVPTNVVWCDFETDQEAWEYDLGRLQEGGGPNCKIHYVHCRGYGTLQNQADQIRAIADQDNAGLIVVDSIAAACEGNIKDNEVATNYHRCLAWFQRTTASIAHPPKAETDETSVSGAGQFEDLARNVWEATYEEGTKPNTGFQTLFHKKAFKSGKLPVLGYRYVYGERIITITPDKPPISSTVDRMSDPNKILFLLRSGPKTRKEIQEAVKKSYNSVSVRLTELEHQQKIIKLGTGKWGLLAYPEQIE